MNLTKEQLKNLELCEAAYWGKFFGKQRNVEMYREEIAGSTVTAFPSIDILAYNRVIGLGQNSNITKQDIESIIEFYKKVKSKRMMVQIPPYLLNDEVVEILNSFGFVHHNNWAKHYLELDNFEINDINSDLKIREVKKEEAEVYGKIVAAAFDWQDEFVQVTSSAVGQEGFRHFFVTDNDLPISIGTMHIFGEYVSMALAATLPEHRGKGAQKLLLNHRVSVAKNLGCKYAVTETGEDKADQQNLSFRNMQKFGFELAFIRPNYIKTISE